MDDKKPDTMQRVVLLDENDVLDEFTISEFVAEGLSKLAKVYSTKDSKIIKLFVLPKNSPEYKFRLQKFKGEADCLNKLKDSDYVVKVVTEYRDKAILNGTEVEAHYYAMEKMKMSLESHLLSHTDWPLLSRIAVLRQILQGLKDSHSIDIFHRDLYAPNVLLDDQDGKLVAKLCDFGSAKQLTQKQSNPYFIPMGNLQYTSPEASSGVLGGNNVDRQIFIAADAFSFGLLFYEVISGSRLEEINTTLQYLTELANKQGLFDPSCDEQKRTEFLKNQAIPILKIQPIKRIILNTTDSDENLEDMINDLVQDLLRPDFEDRLQSVDEIIQRIDAIGGATE